MTELTDEQVRKWIAGLEASPHQRSPMIQGGISVGNEVLRLREELAEAERVRDGVFKEMDEVDQHLGKALGYPHYYLKDGKVVGPDVGGAVKDERVCTGEHVPGTLAAEAAGRIDALRDQLDRLREACRTYGDEHGTAFDICLLCSGAADPAGDDVHAIVHEDKCPADPARARGERSEDSE